MAHLFQDSFDIYATAQLQYRYANVTNGGSGGSVFISNNGRTGINALNLTTASGATPNVTLKSILETLPCSIYVGLALYIPSGFFTNTGQSIAPIDIGNGQWGSVGLTGMKCYIYGDGSMQNQFTGASAPSGTFGFGAWHYLEMAVIVGSTTIECTFWVDDIQVADATVTNPGDWDTLTTLQIGLPVVNASSGNPSGTVLIDDLYVNDGSGTYCNYRFGDIDVFEQTPNGPGRVNGVYTNNGGGGTQNWQNCDAIPPATSEYITDATAGDEECFTLSTPGGNTGAEILAQQVSIFAQKSATSGARQIAGGLGNGSAEGFGTAAALTSSWTYYMFPFSYDPVSGGGFDPTIDYQAAIETVV